MPKLYPYIIAYGRHLGSSEAYIHEQIAKVQAGDLPDTVVHERLAADGSGPTGEWSDIWECSGEVRDILVADVRHHFPDWISEQEMAELSDMKHQAQMADLEPDHDPGL